jgi:hypothetical protein
MSDGKKDEKIVGIYKDDDKEKRYISVAHGTVTDLISEDGVEGLIGLEYQFDIAKSKAGLDPNGNPYIGYAGLAAGYPKILNPDNDINKAKMCSIYWNETPLRDKQNGNLNFSDIDIENNQSSINTNGLENTKVRAINERLRGSEENTTANHKHYKIYNKECNKVTLSIKVARLGVTDRYKGTPTEPNENYGQFLDSSVSIQLSYRALYSSFTGQWATVTPTNPSDLIFFGSLTSGYVRDIEIGLPLDNSRNILEQNPELGYGDFLGWEIRVIRSTPEPTTPDVVNETYIDTITEHIEETLMFPQSYVVRSKFAAEYFSQIPDRAYDMRMQKVRIPSNYDPVTRTYWGTWNGTFSDESSQSYGKKCTDWENQTGCTAIGTSRTQGLYWTDNPAWCFYDLLTNERYGLGKYIGDTVVDKWTLYQIAQYCDELVDDGFGGLEPRFSCNIYIQSREDAFQVLNDMASVFRALVYYCSGTVYAVQDSLKDAIFQFNNSNVENGEFNYTTTSARVRHTVAIVRYNDKNNFFKPAIEYVDDPEGIRRYGIKEKEVTAFGCTSRGQAIRLGQWVLSTERLETETVAFHTGIEGSLLRPGDVFLVSDQHRLINRRGGRLKGFTEGSPSADKFHVILDGKLNPLDTTRDYVFTISTPSFFYDPTQVNIQNSAEAQHIRNVHIQRFTIKSDHVTNWENSDGYTELSIPISNRTNCADPSNCDLDTTHSDTPELMSWSILGSGVDNDAGTIQERLNQESRFRVVNVAEREPGKFEISGVEYQEGKYQEIDSALTYTNLINFNIPEAPTAMTITHKPARTVPGSNFTKVIDYSITAHSNKNGLAYFAVFAKKGSNFTSSDGNPPDEKYLIDKIYSINTPIGGYVPSAQDSYYFRVYAVNSLNEYSTSYASTSISSADLGVVMPIRDVSISSLRLTDNTIENQPKQSDPFGTNNTIDEYDGASTRFSWKTSIPQVQGLNIAFDIKFRIRVYEGTNFSGSPSGTPELIINDYRPGDWNLDFTSYEFSLADNANLTLSNSNYNLENLMRGYTIMVDAVDENGNYSSASGNTGGFDWLMVNNPEPNRPDHGCAQDPAFNANTSYAVDSLVSYQGFSYVCIKATSAPSPTPANVDHWKLAGNCIQTFIDINNRIKIYNVNRPYDAKSVYVIAAEEGPGTAAKPKAFTYQNFLNNPNDPDYKFNIIKISPIDSTDPVFEVDPSFKTDDLEIAYVAIAYTDQFDEEVETFTIENGITNYDLRKQLANRISNTWKANKVTPEVIDLIGEGWKTWIKIDVNGKWYGMGVKCVQDVTSSYSNYKGYLPFYCTTKTPLIDYIPGDAGESGTPAIISAGKNLLGTTYPAHVYSFSCLYYLKEKYPTTAPNTTAYSHTREVHKKGGYTTNTHVPGNEPPYTNYSFPKGFKRYRIWFEKPKDPDNYWVVGMNANEKDYFSRDLIRDIGGLFKGTPQDWDENQWEEYFDAGAQDVLSAAQQGNNEELYIGGSDAYFNYHPAGFVQGFGGLPKTLEYFDVHLGHMIDNSYLKDAMFFVMASTQNEKSVGNPPCN